jgi:acyl transferase domain-containing protein
VSGELISKDAPLAPLREVGVYVGIQQMEYAGLCGPHLQNPGPYMATGSPFSVAAGRVSFTFGLKGELDGEAGWQMDE